MFKWLQKYIRRIDFWGVGVEFREPTPDDVAESPTPGTTNKTSRRQPVNAVTRQADLAEARDAFLAEVGRSSGDAVRADYAAVLDAIIAWTERQGNALVFAPHAGSQALVKFCIPGVETSFWSAWPRRADGAKLHLLTDPHPRFPEALRDVARRELARIDGRQPNPGELPVVSFSNLRSDKARRDLDALLSRLLAGIQK